MQAGMTHYWCRLISETDVGTAVCLLAHDDRTMPSASQSPLWSRNGGATAATESLGRGGSRVESPFVSI